MKNRKDNDLEILKQAGQLGGGVAVTTGLKGALNSILSGKAGTVAKMLPKALGRGAGAAGIAMAMSPDDVSKGATEVERKLEAGEPLSEQEALELENMKMQAGEEMRRAANPEARSAEAKEASKFLNKAILDRETEPTEQEMVEQDPVDDAEAESGISEEAAKKMRTDELLKKLRMFNI